jgi:HAD superfamily hydrolase (TIGR01509 family)
VQRPGAVIFDMDGLMVDTEPLAARAWTVGADDIGIDFDHAVTARLIGRNYPDCMALLRAHHGDAYPVEDLMRAWHHAYDAIVLAEGIALKPGLLPLLAWLEAEAIPKAVATSTRRSRALAKLEHIGLLARFPVLVGGDEVANGKPAPDIFVAAAESLGVAAHACLVLEDSEPGVRGALAAGMTPIMVPDLNLPSQALLAHDLLVMPTLHAVLAYLAPLPAATRVR